MASSKAAMKSVVLVGRLTGPKGEIAYRIITEVAPAYPYGDCADREVEAVAKAGYRFGVATVSGPTKMADNLMRIRRITMFPNTDSFKFWKKTSG